MIRSIKLTNFKGHKDTRIEFDPSRLTILVGPNSSGKTSILQALKLYGALNDDSFENLVSQNPNYNSKNIISFDSNKARIGVVRDALNIESNVLTDKYPYQGIHITLSEHNSTTVIVTPVDLDTKEYDRESIEYIVTPEGAISDETVNILLGKLGKVTYLQLSSEKLAEASYSENIAPRINPDGSGLASAIDHIRNEHLNVFNTLNAKLHQIVPVIKSLRPRRAKIELDTKRFITVENNRIPISDSRTVIGEELVFQTIGNQTVSAHAVSEGTLLTVGLLTELLQPPQPNILLLDDIERGLHPTAQRQLMKILKTLVHDIPSLQVICTTHSPYIVDELESNQVWVLNTNREGTVFCKNLKEHPEAKRAMQILSTGEFWDAEGEDWVLEGQVEDV